MSDIGYCRSCGLLVVWAKTKAGKLMPVQRQAGGNVCLSDGIATVVEPGHGTHVAHFATCPKAKAWRKR